MLRIRDYIPNDLDGLKICLIALQEAEQEFSPLVADGRLIADDYFSELMHRTSTEAGKIIVAEHDNQIAGYVAIQSRVKADKIHEIAYEYAYISDLVVLPEYRGLGYGRALLDEAIEFAKSQKAKLIRIGVAAQNTPANKLYVENGFEPIAIIMEKTL